MANIIIKNHYAIKRYMCKVLRISLCTILLVSSIAGCGKKTEKVVDSQGRIVLKLATFGDDYNLAGLISGFNKKQNDYYIETVSYERLDLSLEEEESSLQLDDGISILQREIVSGNGPDLIDFGDFFTTSDICGEYTENLRDYFSKEDEDFSEIYYENVFDAFSYKDKLYCVPASFYIDTMVGKKKNLEGIDLWNLDRMVQTISEKDGMALWPNATQMDVFTTLLTANMEQYINWEEGNSLFDSDSFKNLLTYSKGLPTSPGSKVYQKEFGEDKVLLYSINTGSVYEVTSIKTLFGKDELSFIGYPTDNGGSTKVQTGATVLAISSSSKNKDAAFEFIKYVLSEDTQRDLDDGFSVNRKVLKERIQEAMSEEYEEVDGKKEPLVKDTVELSEEEGIDIYKITEDDAMDTEVLLDSNFCSCNIDWNLYYVVLNEAKAYFGDEQDLDKTIDNIQSRAAIYVAEKGM